MSVGSLSFLVMNLDTQDLTPRLPSHIQVSFVGYKLRIWNVSLFA